MNNKVVSILKTLNMKISTMESCTGGHLINKITDIEGSSAITNGSFVTYSNEQKIKAGVPEEIINKFGVYSPECALAMATALKNTTNCDIGVGITGTLSNIDPNNPEGKIGTVFYAIVIFENNKRIKKMKEQCIKVPIMERSKQKEYIVNSILQDLYYFLQEH